jgi:hypothetical protein
MGMVGLAGVVWMQRRPRVAVAGKRGSRLLNTYLNSVIFSGQI